MGYKHSGQWKPGSPYYRLEAATYDLRHLTFGDLQFIRNNEATRAKFLELGQLINEFETNIPAGLKEEEE